MIPINIVTEEEAKEITKKIMDETGNILKGINRELKRLNLI